MSGILSALRGYLRDAAPGGVLNPEVTPQGILDSAAISSMVVPGVGDVAGLLADVNRYRTDPASRTPGNFALTGIGMLPLIPSLTVWHGSPHRFAPTPKNPLGEFDPTKIGTGEGAQARGYGHYVAEAPEVGEQYLRPGTKGMHHNSALRDVEKWEKRISESGKSVPAGKVLDDNGNLMNLQSGMAALESAKKRAAKYVDTGVLYKSDLADEAIPKMLDLDKPLSQQTPEVKGILERFGFKEAQPVQFAEHGAFKGDPVYKAVVPGGEAFIHHNPGFPWRVDLPDGGSLGGFKTAEDAKKAVEDWAKIRASDPTGDEIYRQLAQRFGKTEQPLDAWKKNAMGALQNTHLNQKAASEALREAGISGNLFLDAGSRGAGQGTRNFVVFPGNEGILNILDVE